MKFINLGGLGGCRITDVLNICGYRTEAYPFDWNNTNQKFPINAILSKGKEFFSFEDKYVINSKSLISPCYNAFTAHDFDGNWENKKNYVKEKYLRRLNRLFSVIDSTEKIIFCREMVEEIGYRDHADVFDYAPLFKIFPDSILEWEKFIDYIDNTRKAETKLLLFTVNKSIDSSHKNIEVVHWNRNVEEMQNAFNFAYNKY